jgi:CDP-2,3-bis-(O-geranylgeranyl)-sn-glycerol synthase
MQGLPSGQRLLELLLLMAPAYVANMAPPFLRFWHGPNPPISRRWLGDHKTVGGFIVGTLVGALVAWAISMRTIGDLAYVENSPFASHWFWFGISMGFAALLGDSIKSFFKRRLGIQSGSPWIPFDQLDFVVAALLVLSAWVRIGWGEAAVILVLSFIADLLVNQASYRLGIKRDPW